VTTYECLFDRKGFYIALEQRLSQITEVEDLIIVWGANVPLAKFSVKGINVDLVFADFATPKLLYGVVESEQYLKDVKNINIGNTKSQECMLSYMTMLELK
jgi:poly(A) polymerase Pap1